MSLSDQLRNAIHGSGCSLYAIAKAADVHYAVVHGFANGHRDIKLETADQLAELFQMRLTVPRRPKTGTVISKKARGRKSR